MSKCIECQINKGICRSKIEKILCKNCAKLDKYTLITKTNCKKFYFMTDDDLEDVDLDEYYGTGAFGSCEATYYIKEQIILKACEKFNTTKEELDNVLENIVNQKRIKKQQRENKSALKRESDKEKRKQKLTNALVKAGLVLRDDSVLCQKYINGDKTINSSLNEIVERMCQMKYLFEFCHMDECKDIAYEEYTDELNSGYFPDCSVFDRAEDIALGKYSNGQYPNKYPWQN